VSNEKGYSSILPTGNLNVPAATLRAEVIVVFASFKLERLSQVAADAGITVNQKDRIAFMAIAVSIIVARFIMRFFLKAPKECPIAYSNC
jgi:hypothetical protein